MQDKSLYVFRKLSSTDSINHLIAILSRDGYGEYHLRSLLNDSLDVMTYGLPILSKANGENGKAALCKWLGGFLPPLDNKPVLSALLDKFGMTEYDEWEWLKHYRPEDSNLISFSETLPQNVIRHDLEYEYADDEYYDDLSYESFEYDGGDPDDFFDPEDAFYDDEWDYDEEDEAEATDQPCNECPESPQIPLKDFTDQQEMNIVTDKSTIRSTFISLLDVSIKDFFARFKNPAEPITKISNQYGVTFDEVREMTINDVINRFTDSTKLHFSTPHQYSREAEVVYSTLSLPLVAIVQAMTITF